MKYTIWRRKDAIMLGLNLAALTRYGIKPNKSNYGWFIKDMIDVSEDETPQDIVERIYSKTRPAGRNLFVGDVVEMDDLYWFIDSIGVKELPEFGKEG